MEPIRALIIVEMIGRPKQHLEETLKDYIKKFGSEEGITLINEKVHEPKQVEYKKNKNEEGKIETKIESELFSTFAELEFEAKDINSFMRIILFYMPAHAEIISPTTLELENVDLNSFFNEIIRKMHEYDGIAKSMIMENKIIKEKFRQILADIQKPEAKMEENLPPEEKKEEKVNVKPKKVKKKEESS